MINTSFLGNPKPSRGQDRPFGPRPDAGPSRTLRNAFGAAISAPSLHNRAGIMSNATITYPFLSRPWKDGEDKTLTEGSLLFAFRDNQHSARNHGRHSYSMVVVADLTMINRKFADASHALEQKDGAANRQQLANARMQSGSVDGSFFGLFEKDALQGDDVCDKGPVAENGFLMKWSFVGVMRNESNPRGKLQRMLNADVRGRSRVRNIWGADVVGGDRLYVQLVRGRDRCDDRPYIECLSEESQKNGWLMMPVRNPYTKKDCKFRNCCLIPIGTVTSAVCRKSAKGTVRRALYEGRTGVEGNVLVSLDFIEILVGINCN